jgi:hypothetical protein
MQLISARSKATAHFYGRFIDVGNLCAQSLDAAYCRSGVVAQFEVANGRFAVGQ